MADHLDRKHLGIFFLSASLVAGLYGCSVGERVLTPEEQIRELTIQRDRALSTLEESLESLNKNRGTLGAVLSEKSQLHSDLEAERTAGTELRATIEQLNQDKAALDEQLQASRKEYSKLKETHEKLEQLGRKNLEELSEMRQRMGASTTERQRIEQVALLRNRQMEDLTRKIESLQSSLVEEQAVSETLKKRLSISIAADEDSGEREASPQSLVNDFLSIFTLRLKKAFRGEVAWDAFDITVVSAAGSIFLVLVVGWFLLIRVRRLRRRLKQYQLTVKRPPGKPNGGNEGEAASEEDAAELTPSRSRAAVARQESDWLSKTSALRPIRRAAPNFSPIVRAETLRQDDAEAGAEEETENQAERTQFIPLTGVRSGGGLAAASAPRPPHKDAPPPPARPHASQRPAEEKPAPPKTGKIPGGVRPPAGGGEDEQDILNELKQIIDKKFNQVMDHD